MQLNFLVFQEFIPTALFFRFSPQVVCPFSGILQRARRSVVLELSVLERASCLTRFFSLAGMRSHLIPFLYGNMTKPCGGMALPWLREKGLEVS